MGPFLPLGGVHVTDKHAVIEQHVPYWRPWLHKVAKSMLGNHDRGDEDDLCQEGLIAMWRAIDTHDPDRVPLAEWMKYRAHRRMLDVLHDKPLTGQVTERGQHATVGGRETRDKIRAHLRAHPGARNGEIATAVGISASTVTYQMKRLHLDAPAPTVASLDMLLDYGLDPVDCGDALDRVLDAYHHGEVAASLDLLTEAERRYVTLRFWHGLTGPEIRAAFGYDAHGLWRTARERLRPALEPLLA